MAVKNNSESTDVMIKKFKEVIQDAQNLNTVMSNFSTVVEVFNDTLVDLDKNFSIKEINELSNEAIQKLQEINSMNEYELLEKLESIVDKSSKEYMEPINHSLETIIQQTKNNDSHYKTVTKTLKLLTQSINKQEDSVKEEINNDQFEQIMGKLQQMENKMKSIGQPNYFGQNEEIFKLRKQIINLNNKIKRIEENYEDRLQELENEIFLLKNQKGTNDETYDISDEDLPF
ncbi:hypothetical protein [Niallia sp. MER TA 168]|uniref:hypothetical protein n=1 Tax=Niallia sp. MER TA 168 TaxID=2939568 RepID=UPI002041F20D|nr:hypothetical protein [Niallia sp. MER TA 168]MCM3364888.1 hypothetical protein [Niallia sp. MER TA 168]